MGTLAARDLCRHFPLLLLALLLLGAGECSTGPEEEPPDPPPPILDLNGGNPTASTLWQIRALLGTKFSGGTNQCRRDHSGIDIAVPQGTAIYAVEAGAADTYEHPDEGKVVRIEHAAGFRSAYLHLDDWAVSSGAQVARGELIGYSGNTGDGSNGKYHLHFVVKHYGNPVDPLGQIQGGYNDVTDPACGEKSCIVDCPDLGKSPQVRDCSSVTVSLLGPVAAAAVTGTGIQCPEDCAHKGNDGDTVTLTAQSSVPSPYGSVSYFDGWGGACAGQGNPCSIALSSAVTRRVSALYRNPTGAPSPPFPRLLETTVVGSGTICSGTSCPGDGAIACAGDPTQDPAGCSEQYPGPPFALVHLTAAPAAGWHFAGWQGGPCADQPNPCILTMHSHQSVGALFEAGSAAACGGDSATLPGGVSSSGTGGLESMPLWLWRDGLQRDRERSHIRVGRRKVYPPPLWKWANDVRAAGRRPPDKAVGTLVLADLLPPELAGAARLLKEPQDVLGNSNALETLGADYVRTDVGLTRASVSVFKTLDHVYAHDYGICSRFKDGHLLYVEPVEVMGAPGTTAPLYFWGARMIRGELILEHSTVFAVHVSADEQTFTVDSHWMASDYPTVEEGYFLTFQIWAEDPLETVSLGAALLEILATHGTLAYENTTAPPTSDVLLASAVYDGADAVLSFNHYGTVAKTLDLTAVTWSAPYPGSETLYELTQTVEPGAGQVRLPLPGMLNGMLYLADGGGFLDAVYLADGNWFPFDDTGSGGTSSVELSSENCSELSSLGGEDRIVAGCARLTGTIGTNGWAGMIRGLNPPQRPTIDVSGYEALTFHRRGDGKSYRVLAETDAVTRTGTTDFHQFVFTADSTWRQIVLPLDKLIQQGWEPVPVPFSGKDLKSLIWMSVGSPHPMIDFQIDRVGFLKQTPIRSTTRLAHTADTAGPYVVETVTAEGLAFTEASLYYRAGDGQPMAEVAMSSAGSLLQATIPGQPLGTQVRYYVRVVDAAGNVATDPPDAPFATFRFQVSDHPFLLVDDFSDTDPANTIGGQAELFGFETGASILLGHDRRSLRLDFDVRAAQSYAGYVSQLDSLDVSAFDTLTFEVWGAVGGEKVKVGIADGAGHEPKILIGQYLRDGLLTQPQRAEIPLVAFTEIQDFSHLEKLVVVFEDRIGSGNGSVFLDDVRFESLGGGVSISIDNYNDGVGENGLGGSLWASHSSQAGIAVDYDPGERVGSRGAGYAISYSNVGSTEWVAAGTDLRGLDASGATKLSLFLRGKHGGERPNIYLASGQGAAEVRRFVDVESYREVTTAWQLVEIPLADFAAAGVDLSNLSFFQVVFEWDQGDGTIYLDDVTVGEPLLLVHLFSDGFESGHLSVWSRVFP